MLRFFPSAPSPWQSSHNPDACLLYTSSFYRNYKNKEDILEKYLFSIISHWKSKNETEHILPNDLLKRLFEHLIEYKDFYTLLYQKSLFYLFKDVLKEVITAKKASLSNIEAYATAFISYGIYGWTEEWLRCV